MQNSFINKFYEFEGTQEIVDVIQNGGFEIRFVGGCVRNVLLDLDFDDIDFVTTATPQKVLELLRLKKIHVVETGIKHGTVTAFIKKNSFEITTARKDAICDGRYAIVEFTTSFEEDAKRRDFTINAISMSGKGEIFDYYDGLDDLKKGIIRFVGNPEDRIIEDSLRILRLFRFYSYYGKVIDERSLNACKQMADKIQILSAERIRSEFGKILISPNLINAINLMFENRVLQQFVQVKSLNLDFLENLIKNCQENSIEIYALRNFITIIYSQNVKYNNWIKSKKELSYLSKMLELDLEANFDTNNLKAELYKLGKEIFLEKYLLLLSFDQNRDFKINYSYVKKVQMPLFPLKGEDLIILGIKPGLLIGKLLKFAEEAWINSGFQYNKKELLIIIKKKL